MPVDKYLYRGPHPHISDLLALKKEGVNQIYDFRHIGVRGFKFVEKFACKVLGIDYKRYPFSYLKDQYPCLEDFENIAKNVKQNGENGGKTLFHCNSGSHRTAHMAAFYDLTKGEPLREVLRNTDIVEYALRMDAVRNRHFYQKNYFNRKDIKEKTYNPIKYLRIKFNQRVRQATMHAHASFMAIVTGYKQW